MVLENRTNNKLEGWHRRFNTKITAKHPNIWTLIDKLKEEQSFVEMEIVQLVAGQQLTVQKKKYKALNDKIFRIASDFNAANILEYLIGIAQNTKFQE